MAVTAGAGFLIRWDSLCKSWKTNLMCLNGKLMGFIDSQVKVLKVCLGPGALLMTRVPLFPSLNSAFFFIIFGRLFSHSANCQWEFPFYIPGVEPC